MIIKATSEAQEPRDVNFALTRELRLPALGLTTGHACNWQHDAFRSFPAMSQRTGGTTAGPSAPLDQATKQPLHWGVGLGAVALAEAITSGLSSARRLTV